MNKLINKQIFLALFFVLIPLTVSATGLGKLNVFSALGEPLNAEIELLSATPEELETLTASLGSEEQYAAQGIDKSAIQQNIKVDITKKPNGTSVVQLTSSQVVTDPFLDILVQVVWSDGQLSREYTLLLDPSDYSASTINSPAVEASQAVAKQSALSPQADTHVKAKQSVTTVKGDSLSAIAKRIQVQDVNLDQMLLGLYKANPNAFDGGNMNRLKVGQVIHVPSAETLLATSQDEAKAEIKAQTTNWHAYVAKLSDAVGYSDANDNAVNNQSSGKVATKAEDKAAPVADGPRDVVKLAKTELTKASEGSSSQAETKTSEQANANLQDDLVAKENAIKETDEKSAALEKQIADMKKLLAIKNKNMADVQKAAEQTKKESEDTTSILGGVDSVLASVVGGVFLLLIVVWFWFRKKNKVQSSVEPLGEEHHDVFAQSVANSIVDSTSFLNDFSADTSTLIDTHEVDPLAEAEVFLNYGRHAQAEDILKEAILKSPERYELHQKLLEIYAQLNNASAFELLAVELFSQIGSNDPIWAKVSELGLTIDPENKLYHRAKDNHSSEVSETKLAISDFADASLMEEHAPVSNVLNPLDSMRDEGAGQMEEISLGVPEVALKPLEMDLTGIDLSFESIPQFGGEDTAVPTAIPDAFNGDFSNLLKVDIKPHATSSAPKQTAPKKVASNLGNKKTSNDDESSDVATKLELAIAYIDMADKEGALELLAEALIEGGPQQRERAQALIDSLA